MRRKLHGGVLGLAAFAALAVLFASAQTPAQFGKVTDFKVPDYFPPPHHRQMRTLLQGAEAEPDGQGRIRIRQLQVRTFREDGQPEMFVEAPECLYDPKSRIASSPGPIKGRTADDRLKIQGTGFRLVTTNKTLTISNNVRTVMRNLGAATNTP